MRNDSPVSRGLGYLDRGADVLAGLARGRGWTQRWLWLRVAALAGLLLGPLQLLLGGDGQLSFFGLAMAFVLVRSLQRDGKRKDGPRKPVAVPKGPFLQAVRQQYGTLADQRSRTQPPATVPEQDEPIRAVSLGLPKEEDR